MVCQKIVYGFVVSLSGAASADIFYILEYNIYAFVMINEIIDIGLYAM
jgi:hypothetical protein